MDINRLAAFESSTGMVFQNKEWLKTALTHSSYARVYKRTPLIDNERLEFFGDAVLKLLVSDYLFHKFPSYSEGELTKLRAQLISDKNLAYLADKLGLGGFLMMSHGEKNTGGDKRLSNLANTFEALLGAYFLDSGWQKTQVFFNAVLKRFELDVMAQDHINDYKTTLQELTQRHRNPLPVYRVVREEGPDHHKLFHVMVQVCHQGQHFECHGEGRSKKDAEQMAAKQALESLS